jgi:hypothetical protein
MKFHCKEFDCETDDIEDCPECSDYAGCKASGYFTKVTSRQKKQQTFPIPKTNDNGAFPDLERISEIQSAIKGSWPEKCSMPPCPLDQENCWNCDKRLEGLKVNFLPCARDIAHFAALYEAQRNAANIAVEKRVKVDGARRVAESRMQEKAAPKVTVEKGFFPDGLPRVLNTYIANTIKTERLNAIVERFIKGYSLEKEEVPGSEPEATDSKKSPRAGTRQFVSFIKNIDDLLVTEEKIPKDELIMTAMSALEPPLFVSPEAVRTARFRYRHHE